MTVQGHATRVRAAWVRTTCHAKIIRVTCPVDLNSEPYAGPIHGSPSPPVLLLAAVSKLLLLSTATLPSFQT